MKYTDEQCWPIWCVIEPEPLDQSKPTRADGSAANTPRPLNRWISNRMTPDDLNAVPAAAQEKMAG
jgi:hypothetical protein